MESERNLRPLKNLLMKLRESGNYENIEGFFITEEKLLESLFRLEKIETKKLLRLMIDDVSKYAKGEQLLCIKYYFITLSALVARHLEKTIMTPRKAFAFNFECMMLIDRKLNERNAVGLADELIEFYMYMLTEKKHPLLKHHTVNDVIRYVNAGVESSNDS